MGMTRGQQTGKKQKPIKYYDYSLLFLIIFLLCFGLVMLYSTSSYAGANKFGDAAYCVKNSVLFLDEGEHCCVSGGNTALHCRYFYRYRGKRTGEMVENRTTIVSAIRTCKVCSHYFPCNRNL